MWRVQIAVVAIALAGVLACGRGEEDAPPALSEAEIQRLETLGYVDYDEEPTEDAGVVFWDSERVHSGYNLVTLPAFGRAELVDMEGEVVRSWTGGGVGRWERAVLAQNGDLLVTAAEGPRENRHYALLRLTWDGELRWRRELPVHHHVAERPDGSLVVLTRRQRWLSHLASQTRLIDNGVALLSPDGELLEERSLHDMLSSRPDLFAFLPTESDPDGAAPDFLHANFLHWMRRPTLARRDSLYALSNVLVTIRNQDTIAVFDFEEGEFVWAWGQGELLRPHDATVLANGNVLVFDNRTGEGTSRIIELDPIAREIVWEYRGGAASDFYSRTRGTVQRFRNGNTLIGESNRGRAFEVTPEGDVVWEYRTPHRNEKNRPAALRVERYLPSEIPIDEAGSLPPVILITIDTLRADHLGCYGYPKKTSPRIDAFSDHATRYSRAISTSSWTIPSHASMFTGKLPFEHGAHRFEMKPPENPEDLSKIRNENALHETHLTLAEALKKENYETAAFVANSSFLDKRWQLDQGFDFYYTNKVYSNELNLHVFRWLENREDQPFFLFINYIDTHTPYNTKPRSRFLVDEPSLAEKKAVFRAARERILPAREPVPVDVVDQLIGYYDTSVANVDEQIGALLDRLVEMGIYDESIVIVTSDHGEYFGEHRLVFHGKDLYQPVLAIPLIIKKQFQKDGRVEDVPVSCADISRLIASELPDDFQVRYPVLFSRNSEEQLVVGESYYTIASTLFNPELFGRFNLVRTAIYDWPFKLIHSSDQEHELYDLEEDPGESRNLIDENPERVTQMVQRWFDLRERRVEAAERIEMPPLTEEEERRLRSLGYVR